MYALPVIVSGIILTGGSSEAFDISECWALNILTVFVLVCTIPYCNIHNATEVYIRVCARGISQGHWQVVGD